MPIERNKGFDDRIFLTAAEWDTFCRRKPVRYIHKRKEPVCQVCGLPATPNDPLQNAHIISFDVGVIDLALTPDSLDSDANIVSASESLQQGVGTGFAPIDDPSSFAGNSGIAKVPSFLHSGVVDPESSDSWREQKRCAAGQSLH